MLETIDRKSIEDELRSQATRQGIGMSNFATTTASRLKEVEREAEGITDEEARNLLLYAALENFIPSITKRLQEEGEDAISGKLLGLLFLVLAVTYFINTTDEKHSELLRAITAPPLSPRRSLMRFSGIGKGQPGAIGDDVQGYIDAMRDEWEEREIPDWPGRGENLTPMDPA